MNIKAALTSLFKTLAFTLVLAVLFPSAVKLTHAFTHHSHKVCDSDNDLKTHFHESDIACDFYKFKLTNTQFLVIYEYDSIARNETTKTFSSHYISFKNHQHLTRFVRGPPQVS